LAEGFAAARKKIDDILKGMQADVNNFGLDDAHKKINELKGLSAIAADFCVSAF